MNEAAQNIQTALDEQGKRRDWRKHALKPDKGGSVESLVGLRAADVVTACDAVAAPDQKVNDLRKGSAAGNLERKVFIRTDDAFYILDAQPKE